MNLKLALLSLSCARIRASGDATDLDIPGGSGPGGGGGPGGGASVPAGTESNTCLNDMPTDNTNAVLIKFVTNTGGGEPGEPCPMDCDAADALIEAYYPIANPTYDHCYQWPGNSGTNAMMSGACTDDNTFTYDQWPNCDCSGPVGYHKVVPSNAGECVVDNPNNLCAMVVDYSACLNTKQEDKSASFLRIH